MTNTCCLICMRLFKVTLILFLALWLFVPLSHTLFSTEHVNFQKQQINFPKQVVIVFTDCYQRGRNETCVCVFVWMCMFMAMKELSCSLMCHKSFWAIIDSSGHDTLLHLTYSHCWFWSFCEIFSRKSLVLIILF